MYHLIQTSMLQCIHSRRWVFSTSFLILHIRVWYKTRQIQYRFQYFHLSYKWYKTSCQGDRLSGR